MKEFFVGLMVLLVLLLLSTVWVLLLPFVVVLGFFLQWLVTIALLVLAVWLVGKVTLLVIDHLKKRS